MRPTVIIAAASFAALLAVAGQAQAQANRTFVSGHGADSNSCSVSAPCRTFAQAITQTNASGEIVVLDSAGYGTLTIDKSITITNPGGVEAGITAPTPGQTAIGINPSSSFVVTLRGLTVEGGGTGLNGIVLTSTVSGTLNIIDCVVKDFTNLGIAIEPSSPATANVLIANGFVLNNVAGGIEVFPQNAGATVDYSIDHTTVSGNGRSGSDAGIVLNSSGGFFTGTISSVQVHNNNIGINIIGDAFVNFTAVSNSVLTNNTTDLSNNSGGIQAYLLNSDQIITLSNSFAINSDGTNDIIVPSGNALTKFPVRS